MKKFRFILRLMGTPIFNPMKVGFPIFWFPILLPLLISVFSVLGDMAKELNDGSIVFVFSDINKIMISIFKNSNLSFLSVDIWAITTVVMLAAKRRLDGIRVWARSLGIIIGMFVHTIFYLLIILFASYRWALLVDALMTIVGLVGVLMIRITVMDADDMDIEEIDGID